MNAYQVVDVLSKITYKPGYDFKVHINNGLVTFNVRLETWDADLVHDPKGLQHKIVLNFSTVFNPIDYFSAAQLVQAVQQLIQDFEIHEMHEWLKFDGALVTKPHLEKMYVTVRR